MPRKLCTTGHSRYGDMGNSKPVVGAQAKRLLKAIKEGKSLTNDAAQATIDRLVNRRQSHDAERKKAEVRHLLETP